MRFYKNITLLTFLLLSAVGLRGQGLPPALEKQFSTYLTHADFSYVAEGEIRVSGEGKLFIQDSCYVLDLTIMKIQSDGVHRWTVDSDAKEVYIEKVEASWQGIVAGYQILDIQEQDGKVIAQVRSQEGTALTITMPSMKLMDKQPVDFFRFDTRQLGGGWVITDLSE